MVNNFKLTVSICTYNRSKWLDLCLESLAQQSIDMSDIECLVINNNSTDDTKKVVSGYIDIIPNLKLIDEPNQGLSYARNRAIKEANSNWLAFIDDDGKVRNNYISEVLKTINSHAFDCFGGNVIDWFYYGVPKWKEYSNFNRVEKFKDVKELKNDFISGGISIWKLSVFSRVGLFPTDIGMNGNKIAYGEETLLQVKIRDLGGNIGYNPKIILDHLYAKEKCSLIWQFKSSYANGRDHWLTFNTPPSLSILIMVFLRLFYSTTKSIFKASTKLYHYENYYISTMLYDVGSQFFRNLGMLISGVRLR